jgi:F-type H+-transporting ATPase subunit b
MKTLKHLALAACLSLAPAYLYAQEAAPADAAHEAAAEGHAAEPAAHGEAAAEAHGGAHGGGHHSMFDKTPNEKGVSRFDGFVYAVINFLLLVTLLVYLLRKPLSEFLVNRREDVRKSIAEAKEAKEKAEKVLADYRRRMEGLESELSSLRGEILSAGERERDHLLAAAKSQSEKIIADAQLMGEQEVRRAKAVLREEMVKLAAELAHARLSTQATAQERDRQISEFISKLEAL